MAREHTAPRFALWTSRLAVAFPFGAAAAARIHYVFTSTDLSRKAEAWLVLLTFPLCLICVLDLVLPFGSGGRTRVAILMWSILGIVLNIGFFVAVAISD